MDEEKYDEVDDSRPFFQRKPYEVGIYISVFDAEANEEKEFGLEHFFLMKTNEVLYEEFKKLDSVNIRAEFARRRLLTDMYIERFEPGIVMAVGFDSMESLNSLWKMDKEKKLTPLIYDILISNEILDEAHVKSVVLVTKLWDDEFDSCKAELMNQKQQQLDIKQREEDMKMVHRLKNYQTYLGQEVVKMRDLENDMENVRTNFDNIVQSIIPVDKTEIDSLREFENYTKAESVNKMYFKHLLFDYLKIIEQWRDYFKHFEVEIVTPLLQIHRVCENKRQQETKQKIIDSIHGMQDMLQPDYKLQRVVHPEMARKILRRDHPLFLGLLSLVPIGVERVTDIDIQIDDYMRDYKFEVVS